MTLRTVLGAILLAASGTAVCSPSAAQVPPSSSPRQGCDQRSARGQCAVEFPVPVAIAEPTGEPVADDGDAGGTAGPVVRPVCPWVTVSGAAAEELRRLYPDAPPDAVFQIRDCADANADDLGGTQFGLGTRWLPAGAAPAPAPPSPTAVALIVYARVQAGMEAPALVSNPPAGAAAVVGLPVFMEVTNWQGPISDGDCVLGVCVDLTAVPSLEFDPGEPQAAVVRCVPPGSRFDAAVGSAAVQAAVPGACAHAYGERTGVAGRPAVWPGSVTVRWAVSWTSNVGDPPVSGTFPDLTLSTGAPRVVDEVQTVVADDS